MKTPTVTHVYIIENELGLIKIGFANNPAKRFKSIESASGFQIVKQFISFPSVQSPDIEHALHRKFAEHRKTGEWFSMSFDDAVAALKALQPDEPQQALTPFNFNSQAVRTTTDPSGQVWFIAQDVCTCLDLNDTSKAVSRLDDDEKLIRTVFVSGQNREILTVNESGLYSLIFTSRKPEAKTFKKWVTSEVLPEIRKTGGYGQITPQIQALIKSACTQAVNEAIAAHTSKQTSNRLPNQSSLYKLNDTQKDRIRAFVYGKPYVRLSEVIQNGEKAGYEMPMQSVAKYLRVLGYERRLMRLKGGVPMRLWVNASLWSASHV